VLMVTVGEGPERGDAFGRALSDMQAGRPGDFAFSWIGSRSRALAAGACTITRAR